MNKFCLNAALILSVGLFLAGCDDDSDKDAAGKTEASGRAQKASSSQTPGKGSPREYVEPKAGPYDSWAGMRWKGVEGTWLLIGKNQDGSYRVMNRTLDGYVEYTGTAGSKGIEFERDGSKESLTAGDGQATGMKYLTEKKDCLVIKSGEGYCRD